MILWIDVESSAGIKQGNGPVTSASQWRYTSRMSKAGEFAFEMPASDPKAILIQRKRIVRAYAMMGETRVNVGSGIIDNIERQVQSDGTVSLRVSGNNLLRELSYRSVLNLKLYLGGNPVSHATALAAVSTYAPAGWTFAPDTSPPNDSVYGYFGGESVLAAIIKIAEKSQNQFWVGADRTVTFASSFTPSGVRAIQARGDLSPATCAIVNLTEQIDTYDLITRIYPRGSGNANAQLTLRATTRSAPAGYVLNTAQNYIENTASVAAYGRIERQVDFRDIGPVDNTDADIQAAANMLFDAALKHLRRNSTELEQATYTLSVAGCSQLLRPMQTIRVVYRDLTAGLDINTDLNILEATWQVDATGIYTTDLVVSNVDRWPKTDVGTIVDSIQEGHVYQALPQLNANSYVTAYRGNVDHNETASFRFRFGDEVTQLQQVLFEFQLLQFESTIRSVTGSTTTSSAGGGGVESASSGGSHTHSVTIPSHSHTVTIAAHSHTVTIASHSHTITVSNHTHAVTLPNHSHSVPNHQHQITVAGGSGGVDLTLGIGGGLGFLTKLGAGDVKINTNPDSGNTTSDSGGGSVVSSASGGGQTVSSSTQTQTTPSSSAQTQTTPSSSASAQAVQTSSADGTHTHAVTIPAHNHEVTPVINTVYGIYREDEDLTYTVGELEYRVNGGSWADLDTAEDVGDGWYALDVTNQVMDSTTYRPLQGNNIIEVRAASAGLTIASYSVIGSVATITTANPHGFSGGEVIEISGAPIGSTYGSDINGRTTVWTVLSPTVFNVIPFLPVAPGGFGDHGSAGNIKVYRTATIDAQLSVRNTIQAIAYV